MAQREYKNPVSGGRSITIDIYAADGDGKIYDIKVQRASSGEDAHRARFHSSMIDTKMLKSGQEFKEIHDSYVIFITAKDVMGAVLSLYHVDRVIQETEGGREIMCQAFEELAEKRAEEAREETREETRIETLFSTIKNLMKSMKWTAEQAMAAMDISEHDQILLKSKL